jgi:hypothetical protein
VFDRVCRRDSNLQSVIGVDILLLQDLQSERLSDLKKMHNCVMLPSHSICIMQFNVLNGSHTFKVQIPVLDHSKISTVVLNVLPNSHLVRMVSLDNDNMELSENWVAYVQHHMFITDSGATTNMTLIDVLFVCFGIHKRWVDKDPTYKDVEYTHERYRKLSLFAERITRSPCGDHVVDFVFSDPSYPPTRMQVVFSEWC